MQAYRLQPEILGLCVLIAAFKDQVACHLQLAHDLLQPGRSDPSRRMLGIGLSDRLQQHSALLDVVQVTSVLWYHGHQVSEIAFRVDNCLAANGVRDLNTSPVEWNTKKYLCMYPVKCPPD